MHHTFGRPLIKHFRYLFVLLHNCERGLQFWCFQPNCKPINNALSHNALCSAVAHCGIEGQMARTANEATRAQKSREAAVVDQSGICHRRKGLVERVRPRPTSLSPLLGDHGADSQVGKINRLGNRRKERLRREVAYFFS